MKDKLDCTLLRQRADQCRQLAGGMRGSSARDRLIEIAIDYEALAKRFEKKPAMSQKDNGAAGNWRPLALMST